jgi:hypothetical protein
MAAGPTSTASIAVDLHGLTLIFSSSDAGLLERFEQVYGHLPCPGRPANSNVWLELHLHPAEVAPWPPPGLPPIAEGELVSYYGAEGIITIRMPRYALITVDLNCRRLTGLATPDCLAVYGAFEDVLMIALAPLYRRQGWFPLHSFAALAPNGLAALLAGATGAGKTTTGLALLSAGWKLLSNDSPLLTLRDGQVYVLAYPGRLSAFDNSLALFPHLHRFIPPAQATGGDQPKRVFRVEEAFTEPWAKVGPAGGVFLPQVVPGLMESTLEEISPKTAVLSLLPQAIEGWDKAAIQQTLHLLTRLVAQAPCYILKLSPRLEQLPELIAGVLAA